VGAVPFDEVGVIAVDEPQQFDDRLLAEGMQLAAEAAERPTISRAMSSRLAVCREQGSMWDILSYILPILSPDYYDT